MRRFVILWFALLPGAALSGQEANQNKANTLTSKEIADGWILLFDGETTFGWNVERGEASILEGSLVFGRNGGVIATTTAFGDCELRFDWLQKDPLDIPRFRVETSSSGESVELASNDPAKTGSGTIRVERAKCHFHLQRGSAKLDHTATADATIGKSSVRFYFLGGEGFRLRNVKLKPVGLKPIFNGKDLAGWKEVKTERTKSVYSVTEKGELNVKNGPGDLQTEGQWDDFVLQMDVISNGKHLNSGVFFRALPGEFWSGYEAQVRNQWQGDDRTKPVDFGTGGIYNRQPARKVVSSDNEWFTMTVIAHGNHLATWVNGYPVADFADTRPAHRSARNGAKTDKGVISLQGHDPGTDLSFRNIRLADLPKQEK